MAPLISYAPGNFPSVPLILGDITIGPTTAVTKTAVPSSTGGTLTTNSAATYPNYNTIGKWADAGEIADCFNQLVCRIEALEAIIAANPAYGITAT